jgi:signal transduction histidine kinase
MPAEPTISRAESPRLRTVDLLGKHDDPSPTAEPRRGATGAGRRLWLICVLLIAATFATGVGVIWQLRQFAVARAERELSNLGTVLAEQTSRTIQSVDLVLQEVQAHVAALDPSSPEAFRTQLDGEPTQQFLAGLLRNLPQAEVITLVDANGSLLNWSRDQQVQPLDDSDRDYFTWLREHNDSGAFIGIPVNGRVSGKRIMSIARRINGPNGAFLGLVVGLIDTNYLEGFYGTISMVAGESVTIMRRDGFVIAGFPHVANRHHTQMPMQSPWYDRVAMGGGSYRSPGYLSGIPRIIAVHPIRDYKLAVDVSMTEQAALRSWYEQASVIAIAMVGVAVALTVLFAVIIAQFRRQEEQNARLNLGRAALRASERQLKAYAEMAADWFWEQDADLRFVRDSNIPFTSLPTDVGKTRWDLADPAMDPQRWETHKAELAARRKFRDFRWERIGTDGKRRHMSTSGDPIFDEAGMFLGYHGTGRDVTADVEAADVLRVAKERAEAGSRARSEFLRNMSHELRTPLHAIIGFSELINDRAGGPIGNNYVDWAGEILNSGRHLLELINDVLDLSRIDTGCYEIADDSVDLEVVARACRGMLRAQAEANQLRVDCEISDAVVLADRRAVKQIMLNLMANAVKFTPAGGVVSIRTEPAANGDLAVVVADTGIGIDPAALASPGEAFTQADGSVRRKYGGTGLGLAISRKLAAMHGGALTIESALGQGTTVRVNFPAVRVLRRPQRRLPGRLPAGVALADRDTVTVSTGT